MGGEDLSDEDRALALSAADEDDDDDDAFVVIGFPRYTLVGVGCLLSLLRPVTSSKTGT